MTKEQILDGKKLCVSFMGLKPTPSHGGGWGWSDTPYFSTQNNPDYDVALEHIVKYAKYDSDWNWLMGGYRKAKEEVAEADAKYRDKFFTVELSLLSANIDAAFSALVKFIQFYNDNSSK